MFDVSSDSVSGLSEVVNDALYLTADDVDAISNLLEAEDIHYCNEAFAEYYWQCYMASYLLPESIQRKLFQVKSRCFDHQFLIRRLPIPPGLGPTPIVRGLPSCKAALKVRKMMTIILSRMGFIYGFNNKKFFDFIDDVFPLETDKHEQLGTNKDFLEWHVEDGFHEAKADWVALCCLRQDPDAYTYLFHAKDIDLDSQHMAALKREEFVIEVDKTFNRKWNCQNNPHQRTTCN